MKITVRILYSVSVVLALLGFAVALLITVFQNAALSLTSAPESVISAEFIFCPMPLLNILRISLFSLLTVVACEVFKKGFWPEIVLLAFLLIFAFGLPDIITRWQQIYYATHFGEVALAKFSSLLSLYSFPLTLAGLSNLIQVLVCGLSIGRKTGDRKLERFK